MHTKNPKNFIPGEQTIRKIYSTSLVSIDQDGQFKCTVEIPNSDEVVVLVNYSHFNSDEIYSIYTDGDQYWPCILRLGDEPVTSDPHPLLTVGDQNSIKLIVNSILATN